MNTSIYGIRYLYINICKYTCVNISSRLDGVGPARIQTGDSIRYCVHCFLCFVQFLLSIGWSKYPTITITDTCRCNGEKHCKGGILFYYTRNIQRQVPTEILFWNSKRLPKNHMYNVHIIWICSARIEFSISSTTFDKWDTKCPLNLRWFICMTQIIDIYKFKNLCGQDNYYNQDQRNPLYTSPSATYQRQ